MLFDPSWIEQRSKDPRMWFLRERRHQVWHTRSVAPSVAPDAAHTPILRRSWHVSRGEDAAQKGDHTLICSPQYSQNLSSFQFLFLCALAAPGLGQDEGKEEEVGGSPRGHLTTSSSSSSLGLGRPSAGNGLAGSSRGDQFGRKKTTNVLARAFGAPLGGY